MCHLGVFIPTFFMFITYIGPHIVLSFFNLRMISPLRINGKALFLLIILIFNNETGLSFLEYFSVCLTSEKRNRLSWKKIKLFAAGKKELTTQLIQHCFCLTDQK